MTRRHFFQAAGLGLGVAALGALDGGFEAVAEAGVLQPHHPPRAKSAIFLQMCGGPSQLDLFEDKPELTARHDQPAPAYMYEGRRFAFIADAPNLLGTPYRFARHGESGATLSELLPYTASVADELCFIKSVHTSQFNHAPAQLFMSTGSEFLGRPSMGSWVGYGLGSENKDLPGFVVLVPRMGVDGGKALWNQGFLPPQYQGVQFRTQGEAAPFVQNPPGIDNERRVLTIDAINDLNKVRLARLHDPEIAGRIAAYELAFRMQTIVPELADLSRESEATLELYGARPGADTFANACLLARRLVEAGVRFVQICYRGSPSAIWDCHGEKRSASLEHALPQLCRDVDQPSAALVRDLRQRGLLDETLVVWGGEFGRTCMNENRGGNAHFLGRDHWPDASTIWMAGGGIKPGMTYGLTDEFGFQVVENPVSMHDLHATMLYSLGLDHSRLSYKFQGLDFRLTGVEPGVKVLHDLFT
ncbi:MAG: DUF1501 domain-containing protein [Pirellulaceae bacterium]